MTGSAPLNRVCSFRAVLGHLEPFKAVSLLCECYTGFNAQGDACNVLPTQCIRLSCMGVRINSGYVPIEN